MQPSRSSWGPRASRCERRPGIRRRCERGQHVFALAHHRDVCAKLAEGRAGRCRGVRTDRDASEVQRRLIDAGFLAGPVVPDTDGRPVFLISVTERRTREEIDAFVKAFEEAAS